MWTDIPDPHAPLADLATGLSGEGRLIYDLLETAPPDQAPDLIARLPAALKARLIALSPARQDFTSLTARRLRPSRTVTSTKAWFPTRSSTRTRSATATPSARLTPARRRRPRSRGGFPRTSAR